MGIKETLANVIGKTKIGQELGSRIIINKYGYNTSCRPRAFSMAADYTTWRGLTDRRFSARHLCATASDEEAPAHPDIDQVAALFERKTFRPARDTSILFPFFAQWFTDSFLRTKWEAGEQRGFRENESNHDIDLCQIYGVTEVQTRMLRAFDGGRLETQVRNGEEWPAALFEADGSLRAKYRYTPEVSEEQPAIAGLYSKGNFDRVYDHWPLEERAAAFAVGLEHGNSTLGNTVMNTLFVREHNRTAGILQAAHPDWDDERIFQTARNVTIVVLLNIVIGDYIVHISPVEFPLKAIPGMAEKQRWYRTNWMAVEFALLYRWHDLIPDELVVNGSVLPGAKMRRANRWVLDQGLDAILLAASRQPAGQIGMGNTAPFLVNKASDGGADVKRLSLSMGRACRLPSFNAYREAYGLKRINSFEALTEEREMAGKLRALYGDIDKLEWFVGLFAEGYGNDEMMGELLVNMVANDAFTQALTNPLLAEQVFNERTFGAEGLKIIRDTQTLAQMICRNTKISTPRQVGFKLRGDQRQGAQ